MYNILFLLSFFTCMSSGCKDDQEILFEDHVKVEDEDRIHANEREKPYPREEHKLYINPSPLIVPSSVREKDQYLEFELSQNSEFPEDATIRSGKLAWNMFNVHKQMDAGDWYWRFRVIDADGKANVWSEVNKFTVAGNEPVFVTPEYSKFKENLPTGYPRYYCFLEEDIKEAVRLGMNAQPEKEVNEMKSRANMGLNYQLPSKPWDAAGDALASDAINYLYPAYRMTENSAYKNKILDLARKLLSASGWETEIENGDFWVDGFADAMGPIYDVCYNDLTSTEKEVLESSLAKAVTGLYEDLRGNLENHVFDNHTWQKGVCGMVKGALMVYENHPEVLPALEYAYEVWTARAPASGYNRDGAWHNGSSYYNTNQSTLYYMPMLYSYITGTDFFQHPWYKNSGKAFLYSRLPETSGLAFGDGSGMNYSRELSRITAAWGDFLTRETKDSYAAYVVKKLGDVIYEDIALRLYRMAKHHIPYEVEPVNVDNVEPFIWYKDMGEGIAYSDMAKPSIDNMGMSFRSSPFGSGSHTMSDQNSFKLSYKGKTVYANAGYYQSFADAHSILQYRNTRGHNTIMINNIGQPFTTRAYGNIAQALNGKNIAYFQGDASHAYCGISEYPMWQQNFANAGLSQIPAYGFGETPLNKYVRHIFMLRPNIVVIYDDLGADEPATWQWLLHSPVAFNIAGNKITTNYDDYVAVAHIYSNETPNITTTNEWFQGGEPTVNPNVSKQWHLTADFQACATNKVLTIIQVEDDENAMKEIWRVNNKFLIGDEWEIEAEMKGDSKAYINIKNKITGTVFDYGSDAPVINGSSYQRQSEGSSVLYDEVNGEMTIQEISNHQPQLTRSGK